MGQESFLGLEFDILDKRFFSLLRGGLWLGKTDGIKSLLGTAISAAGSWTGEKRELKT